MPILFKLSSNVHHVAVVIFTFYYKVGLPVTSRHHKLLFYLVNVNKNHWTRGMWWNTECPCSAAIFRLYLSVIQLDRCSNERLLSENWIQVKHTMKIYCICGYSLVNRIYSPFEAFWSLQSNVVDWHHQTLSGLNNVTSLTTQIVFLALSLCGKLSVSGIASPGDSLNQSQDMGVGKVWTVSGFTSVSTSASFFKLFP